MSADWKKMKVQALRDELASRGLGTAGVKSALVERLENIAPSGAEDAGKEDGRKKEVEGIEEGEDVALPAAEQVVLEEAGEVPSETKAPTKEGSTTEEMAEARKGTDSDSAAPAASLTDLEKKRRRAERFGTDLKISEAEKRKMRAARFNGGNTNGAVEEKGTVAAKVPSNTVADAEIAKRKARAERFGSAKAPEEIPATLHPSRDEEAKKKARVARFAMAAK